MYRMCSPHADGLNHLDNILKGFPSPSWIPYRFSSAAKPWNSNPLDPICINSKLARQTFVAQSKPRSCGKGLRGLTATDLRTSPIMNSQHYFGRIFDSWFFLLLQNRCDKRGKNANGPNRSYIFGYISFVSWRIQFIFCLMQWMHFKLCCDCHTKLKITLLFDLPIMQPVWPFASRH